MAQVPFCQQHLTQWLSAMAPQQEFLGRRSRKVPRGLLSQPILHQVAATARQAYELRE